MIVLFTDFGLSGPYMGQMKAVLYGQAPGVPVVDLFADAPTGNPIASAYLLAAYSVWFPAGTIFLCVVDPGVGTDRPAAILEADGRWYVGPDNGLFDLMRRRAERVHIWDITWQPERLSPSFHGRDLFAPVAAMLARGEPPPGELRDGDMDFGPDLPDDLAEIIYIDHYGNAMTGLRAALLSPTCKLSVGECVLPRVKTFGSRPAGTALWYENSSGLAEIAVNRGRADDALGLTIGSPVEVIP